MKSGMTMLWITRISSATTLVLIGFLTAVLGNVQSSEALNTGVSAITFKNGARSNTFTHAAVPDNWKLAVSEDGMRIQKADGSDWYWLGDTAWSLFQELNREDAEAYFSIRASQGFTVIQAVVVMGWNRDWNDKNAYGQRLICPHSLVQPL
ncbi:DUF4038 domain-containing protein [Planctomycetota bacterium]